MNFRFSDLKIDKVFGVNFIDKTTNQVVGHWSHLEPLPEKEGSVEVKSDYFPNGENYAFLDDTQYGTKWFYIGSNLNHRITRMGLELIPEWRWSKRTHWIKFEK